MFVGLFQMCQAILGKDGLGLKSLCIDSPCQSFSFRFPFGCGRPVSVSGCCPIPASPCCRF
jgi:hypothetical protein